MLLSAIFLFVVVAIFGLIILISILEDRPIPKPAVFLHGSIAAIALLLVIIYMLMTGSPPLLITSLVLFIVAALMGLTLATIDIRNRTLLKLLAVIHPLIAVAGLISLIIYVLP